MPNLLEHRFAIKRITKPSNEDYISALKIYNETTPPDIKMHIPADTRSAFPVISVQSPVSIQCCWQS